MNLIAIIGATLVAGIGSVWIAAGLLRLGLGRGADAHGAQYLLSLAAGALLATAFMHLLPEAFESRVPPAALFAVLLFGLVFFFLLDKAELWHHGHEHHHDDPHAHAHAHAHAHTHTHVILQSCRTESVSCLLAPNVAAQFVTPSARQPCFNQSIAK